MDYYNQPNEDNPIDQDGVSISLPDVRNDVKMTLKRR